MDPNYAMAKFGIESKNMLKSKHRGCWYYTKYFFFFLSIIQFLIILGLVLFMLYGNAHVTTEERLKRLQDRFKNLTDDHNSLKDSFIQMKSKLTSVEKANLNCSVLLGTALRQLQNRTVPRVAIPLPPYNDVCRVYQGALEKINTTYIIETLQLKHKILTLQGEFNRITEKCYQTNATLNSKLIEITLEKEKLKNMKEDLETQAKISLSGCTSINQRFEMELERMRSRFENHFSGQDNLRYSNCWSISTDTKNNIDQTIVRMKQDVNNVMFENSRLQTENARMTDNFQKCSQEKTNVIADKNNLSKDKGALEKQLSENKEELNKYATKYMKKEEELENCRKMQTMGRMSGGYFPRT
ncbi:plasmalemma vesicle-associated protein [Engystomops pustulosus]|uniref:plasmalemma vesicle-associated protein n=1 Tax=Engystomops pustulosus TaxID=76066 RepID=UPI003AFB5D0C